MTTDDDFRDLDHQWAMRFRALRVERNAAVAKLDAIRILCERMDAKTARNFGRMTVVGAAEIREALDGPQP